MPKQKSKQRFGKQNGRWKGGKSSDFRRRVTNAKKGELVHHKNHNKTDNSKKNFSKLKPGKAKTSKGVKMVTAIGKHNLKHREKGRI
jgi:hypothetical protein|tara:strand:+ start:738 stop:998 length:261 start_codon:yes stop_codon:yes gene_type:complete